MPLRAAEQKQPTRLDSVVHITRVAKPTEVDHYAIRRVIDVWVTPKGEALNHVSDEVQEILGRVPLPKNTTVSVRGTVQNLPDARVVQEVSAWGLFWPRLWSI